MIGNGAYAHVRALPNPPNDARSVAKSLRDIGFSVSEGIDLDRAAMQKMTRDFLREAARAQVALVYYAGHGVQIDGRKYLVPVDLRLQGGGNLTDGMVDMDTILAGLDDQVRTNILILDACRNNPMEPHVATAGANRAIEAGAGLAAPTTPGSGATLGAGTLIAFATAPGQVALDGEGANSPFSAALSRHIGTPGLEVQQMLTRVRAEVVAKTGGNRCHGRIRRCSARFIWRQSDGATAPSFRGASKTRTSDAQLRIGESRDSGFDALHRPGKRPPYFPHTSLATSTASFSLAHCSSSDRMLPSSVEAKPHCGDTAS